MDTMKCSSGPERMAVPWDGHACYDAATNGHLEILKWPE